MLFRRRVGMAAVVCHPDHFSHFDLLHVERKSMTESCLRIVELERKLVQLESAVSRILPDSGRATTASRTIASARTPGPL